MPPLLGIVHTHTHTVYHNSAGCLPLYWTYCSQMHTLKLVITINSPGWRLRREVPRVDGIDARVVGHSTQVEVDENHVGPPETMAGQLNPHLREQLLGLVWNRDQLPVPVPRQPHETFLLNNTYNVLCRKKKYCKNKHQGNLLFIIMYKLSWLKNCVPSYQWLLSPSQLGVINGYVHVQQVSSNP